MMSDDDRDIDIESDVRSSLFDRFRYLWLLFIFLYYDKFLYFQAENDSDSRTHARNSLGGSGYYSQVSLNLVQ